MSLDDIAHCEEALETEIVVISAPMGNAPVYTPQRAFDKRIYLYFTQENGRNVGHYDVITSMTGLLCVNYYCHVCLKGYDKKERHACTVCCLVCKSDSCNQTDNPITCLRCNMDCRSPECFDRHKQVSKQPPNVEQIDNSQCATWWRCRTCLHAFDQRVTLQRIAAVNGGVRSVKYTW